MLHFLSEAVSPLSIGFLGIIGLVFFQNKLCRLLFGLLPCLFFFVFCTPGLSLLIQQNLTDEFLPRTRVQSINVAVLLGGSVDFSEPSRAQLGPSGDRLLVAKEFYDAKWYDVLLVSGGTLRGGDSRNSTEDRNILIKFGVSHTDVFDEPDSRTTAQNAINAKKWMESNFAADNTQSVYLITSALHMRRAMFEFCLQGIDVKPLVANIPGTSDSSHLEKWLPIASNLRLNSIWFSEELGVFYRRLSNSHSDC